VISIPEGSSAGGKTSVHGRSWNMADAGLFPGCNWLQLVAKIISLDSARIGDKLSSWGCKSPCHFPPATQTRGEKLNKLLLATSFTALLLLVSSAVAQNSNLYFNGSSQGSSYCNGGYGCVDTGFLDGSIDGVTVGPHDAGGPGMICDDYQKNLNNGQQWSANGVDVASLNAGNLAADTLFGKSIGLQGYAELAYLVNQMFALNLTGSQQSAYSQALWYLSGTLGWSDLNVSARALVALAELYVGINGDSLSRYSNLWLYAGLGSEMWGEVKVPEGGPKLGYLLLAGAACFAAMVSRVQSKASQRM
jgi:hypothetical protein